MDKGSVADLVDRCRLAAADERQSTGALYRAAADALERLAAENARLRECDLRANRFYRLMNGMDEDDWDKRAEVFMRAWLDGLTVGPGNRTSVKAALAEHFADIALRATRPAAVGEAEFERDRAHAALELIEEIAKRKYVHLGRPRWSGIAQGCITCIAAMGRGEWENSTAQDYRDKLAELRSGDEHRATPTGDKP